MSNKSACILVVQGGAGDVLAATPMIRSVRNTYPEDEIVVIATHAHLLENNPNIDTLISFDIQREVRGIYDKYIYGENRVRFLKHHFLYDSFMDEPACSAKSLPEFICKVYGVEYDEKPLDYTITPYEREAATSFMTQFSKPVVLLHLTGILPMKSLDLGKIVPILEKHGKDYDFIQIGKGGEQNIEGIHNALGMPMRDTISLMPHAKTSILIESIFAHCSNALGLNSVVVFKSTSPEFFGYDNNFNVWNSGGCDLWPCNRPIGPLNKFLPAYLDLNTGQPLPWMCPDPLCSSISAEEIEKVFLEAIEAADKKEKVGPFESLEEARKAKP